jgi:hypothetical protein
MYPSSSSLFGTRTQLSCSNCHIKVENREIDGKVKNQLLCAFLNSPETRDNIGGQRPLNIFDNWFDPKIVSPVINHRCFRYHKRGIGLPYMALV